MEQRQREEKLRGIRIAAINFYIESLFRVHRMGLVKLLHLKQRSLYFSAVGEIQPYK